MPNEQDYFYFIEAFDPEEQQLESLELLIPKLLTKGKEKISKEILERNGIFGVYSNVNKASNKVMGWATQNLLKPNIRCVYQLKLSNPIDIPENSRRTSNEDIQLESSDLENATIANISINLQDLTSNEMNPSDQHQISFSYQERSSTLFGNRALWLDIDTPDTLLNSADNEPSRPYNPHSPQR